MGNKEEFVQEIEAIIGQVFNKITCEHQEVIFENDNLKVKFSHDQECCEEVIIKQIDGDLQSLIGSPILMAELLQV